MKKAAAGAIVSAVWVGTASAAPPSANDDIPLASRDAAAVETPSDPDAWGGPRTGNEPTLSDRVVRYDIDATLDPDKHTVDAREKLLWQNRSDRRIQSVYLHLYLNAFEGQGSTMFTERRERHFSFRSDEKIEDGEWGHIELRKVEQGGAPVKWTFVHPDGGPETDHTVVRFDLPAPVEPHASTVLDIDFHDQLPRIVARTGYFGGYHMIAQWFPKIGVLELAGERGATAPRWNAHEFHLFSEFYADWGEYDVRLTVPKRFQIASAGEEVGPPVENGDRVTRRFVQGDIHDFAWMAADGFAPPLEGSYDGPGSPHVVVKVFYPPEYAASAAPALRATIDSIRWFSETLGPYPYRTSTCIVPPFNALESGGMEYQTLFTVLGSRDVEPDTFNSILLDFVTIHEFGHGYFYGILASNEFEEPMLDEGLNEFWDFRMTTARNEDIHFTTPFLKRLGFDPAVTGFGFARRGGAADPHPSDAIGENAWNHLSTESYGQVYSRTATVMRDLEKSIGKDAIERGFRAYYARWRFRHPSTADLRDALAENADRKAVERVFRQNVYRVVPIDDRIESLTSEEELPLVGTADAQGQWIERTRGDVEKEVDRKRSEWKSAHPDVKRGEGPFPWRTEVVARRDGAPVPQTLVVRFEDGSVENLSWDDDRAWHRFSFVKPSRARSAELDPEHRIYLDSNKLNDGRTIEKDRSASRRWGTDLSTIVELLFSLLETL